MKRLSRMFSLAAAALLTLACGGQLAPTGTSNNSAPIKVELIATFSGQNADLGNWNWNGVKLALDQANGKGGVNGRKLELTSSRDFPIPAAPSMTRVSPRSARISRDGQLATRRHSCTVPTSARCPWR